MSVKTDLISYYSNKSKHSNYQVLPESLRSILNPDDVSTRTRYEAERLKYLLANLDVKGKTILDIGANTGYFSFELIDAGARNAHCYEGNKEHTEFVRLGAKALGVEDKIRVTTGYFPFDGNFKERYDIVLLFNVLHHVGDDYGDENLDMRNVQDTIAKQLNSLAKNTDTLVFQLGFNWKGDVGKGIFKEGTKKEVIDFVKSATKNQWDLLAIGVAEKRNGTVVYANLTDKNIERDDTLGEFLNRPIFILRTKSSGEKA